MKNIFENAYFGKPYKTRDGRKAIYIKDSQYDDGLVCVVYEDIASIHRVMKSGHYWANSNVETDDDIISEWQETINEEELDNYAKSEER